MRVTQTMLQNNMLRNLFSSQAQMDKYLTQIYTGKKIQKPSDDPVIAMKGINYRTELAEVEQYQRNASEINNWFDQADDLLDKGTEVMRRMEYLAIQAANDPMTPDERKSIMKEVQQLHEQMVSIANSNVNGKYIFNGTDTDKAPVKLTDGKATISDEGQGRNKSVMIEVSKGIQIPINMNPDDMFDQELFDNIEGFIASLEEGTDQSKIDESIKKLNDSMTKIINSRAELGARMNRLEIVEDRLVKQATIAQDTMMKNEGVDFEEAVTNLLTQEVIHRATLSAGAKIIQPSLVDFLR